MKNTFKTVEILTAEGKELVEVELMLSPEELKSFGTYCLENNIKFNDWIRKLALDDLEKNR